MRIKVVTGLLIGALLVWLSFRGIEAGEVYKGLHKINGGFVISSLAVMILMQVLRAIRWGLILKPLDPLIDKFTIFSITSVGFLAIVAIPARLGELARPYLITKKSRIPMSSALGTVFVERVLDILTVLVIAIIVFFSTPLPPWLFRAGATLFIVTAVIFFLMIMAIFRKEKTAILLAPVIAGIPPGITAKIIQIIGSFVEGLSVMKHRPLFGAVVILSFIIWLADALAIYLLFKAFSLNMPLAAPFVIMIILIAGIAIPVAPGFIGNWHYFCILGLELFNVAKTEALAFAVVYHAISIGIIIALGVVFLPFSSFSLADLKKQENL